MTDTNLEADEPLLIAVGLRIKELRLASGHSQQSFAEAAGIVHKIKSSSGSIGARALYQTCAKLQKALEEERTDEIGALRDAFDSLLNGLLKEISGIEPENGRDDT